MYQHLFIQNFLCKDLLQSQAEKLHFPKISNKYGTKTQTLELALEVTPTHEGENIKWI